MGTAEFKEADIFPALAKHYKKAGYKVQGEVVGCDFVAVKGDELVICELKKAFNVKLLYQAVRRLPLTDKVYVAFLPPRAKQKMSYWTMVKSLARRLHIGVYLVSPNAAAGERVKLLVEPGSFTHQRSSSKRDKVLKEFHGRKVSDNIGGVTGQKIRTAYLENAIHIAVLLHKHKKLTAAALKKMGCNEKSYTTLYNNHYGWYKKNGKGQYGLRAGKAAQIKKEHPDIWDYYTKKSTDS